MIHWKVTAGCAGFAVFLSIAAGLFGRVSAGTLVFRALLSGIVFGALASGFEFLGGKYLPELFSGDEAEDAEEPDTAASGGEVDIVVDGEETISYTDDAGGQNGLSEDNPVIEAEGFDEGADDSGAESLDDEDVTASGEGEGSGGAEELEVAEKLEPAGEGGDLPNIEELSNSFGGPPGKSDGLDSSGSGKARSSEALDSLGGVDDPATMAQAIRSMVQKDQEG